MFTKVLLLFLFFVHVPSQMNYGNYGGGHMAPNQGQYGQGMGGMPGQPGQYPMNGAHMTEEEQERMEKERKKNKGKGNMGYGGGYGASPNGQLDCETLNQQTCSMHYPYCIWDNAEPECDLNPNNGAQGGQMLPPGGAGMNGMHGVGAGYPQQQPGNMNPYNNGMATPYNQVPGQYPPMGQGQYNQMAPAGGMNQGYPPLAGQPPYGQTGYNQGYPGAVPGAMSPTGQFPNAGYGGYNNHMLHSGNPGMNTYGATAHLPGNNYMGNSGYSPYVRRLQKNNNNSNNKKLEKINSDKKETKTYIEEHIMHNVWFWLFLFNCAILAFGVTAYGLRTQNKFQIDQTLLYQESA